MNKDKVGGAISLSQLLSLFFYLVMPRHTFIYHTDKHKRRYCTRGHAKGKLPSILNYITINRRINRLDIKIKDTDNKSNKEFKDEYIIIAVDSTSIKVTNRGQWIREKWNVRKKGYLKIHIAAKCEDQEENSSFHE